MSKNERIPDREFRDELKWVLLGAISSDYVDGIIDAAEDQFGFLEYVKEDVECSSGWGDDDYYNEDDIRLAVGRFLCKKLGLDY